MALSVSPARPEVSATRSCESRDSRRTRRPKYSMGTISTGMSTRMISASFRLVYSSSASDPRKLTVERSRMESPAPDNDWISVVSVVRRESTSPVLVTSKNAGSMRITRSYTALRTSDTTRSPIHPTR
jgi:hypothetical protein